MLDALWLLVLALLVFLAFYFGRRLERAFQKKKFEEKVPEIRKKTLKRSRSVLKGKISEQMAPYLPGFDHDPSDIRFLGSPIDFVCFEGLSEDDVQKVYLVEVKTGDSGLSKVEKTLKEAVEDGVVEWEEFRVD